MPRGVLNPIDKHVGKRLRGHTDEEDHWFRRMATIYSDR
jgi:hypothetical protein